MRVRGVSGGNVRRLLGLVFVATVGAGFLQVGQAGAVTPAAVAPRWGYVNDNQVEHPHFTSTDGLGLDSAGKKITGTRLGVGRYQVLFHGLLAGGVNGGTVDVTPDDTFGYCKIASWGPSGTSLSVKIDCYSVGGSPEDTNFFVSFADPGSSPPANLSYVWGNKPAQASYTPDHRYQFNSGGGTDTITQIGTGDYHVIVPGVGLDAGTVKVTAYGPGSAATCQAGSLWGGHPTLNVYVSCYDTSGNPVNAKFTMTWVNHSSLLGVKGRTWGYVWGDDPTSSSYTPTLTYQGNSSGGTDTITRSGTGSYEVDMPGIGGDGGNVQISAFGEPQDHCSDGGYFGSGSTEVIDVICFDTSGNPADSEFTVQYVR